MRTPISFLVAISGLLVVALVALADAAVDRSGYPHDVATAPTIEQCEGTPYKRTEWRYDAAALRDHHWITNPYTAYSGAQMAGRPDGDAVEVEHLVPLREVHSVCGCKWSPDQKAAYASDPFVTVLSVPAVNRDKGASPSWRPPGLSVWFDTRRALILERYGLADGSCQRM